MIQTNKYRLEILRLLFRFMDNIKWNYVLYVLMLIFSTVLVFIEPLNYRAFINDVIMDGQKNRIIYVVIGYVSLYIVNTTIEYAKYYTGYRIKYNYRCNIKSKVLTNYLKKSGECDDVGDIKIKI